MQHTTPKVYDDRDVYTRNLYRVIGRFAEWGLTAPLLQRMILAAHGLDECARGARIRLSAEWPEIAEAEGSVLEVVREVAAEFASCRRLTSAHDVTKWLSLARTNAQALAMNARELAGAEPPPKRSPPPMPERLTPTGRKLRLTRPTR